MGAIITDADVAYLQSVYPDLDIKIPTGQQEQLLLNYFRGMSVTAAAQETGYKSVQGARNFLQSDTGQQLMHMLRDRELNDARITIDSLTAMFLESYHLAATAGEKIAATRELGKLHGIYPDSRKAAAEAQVMEDMSKLTQKKMQQIPDHQLAELAGQHLKDISNHVGETIEGEVERD